MFDNIPVALIINCSRDCITCTGQDLLPMRVPIEFHQHFAVGHRTLNMLVLIVVLALSFDASNCEPLFERSVGDGVNTWDLGRRVVYGDEDITVINEVITDMEKNSGLKSKFALKEQLKPLDPQDVKCLMSVDKYCSKEMGQMKSKYI